MGKKNERIELTEYQKDILTGTLLGDGGLERGKGLPLLCINRSIKDKEFAEWESKIFSNLMSENGFKEISTYDKRTNKIYSATRLRTRSNPVFLDYYNKWYINNIKIVPRDLILNQTIIGKWIADDGSLRKFQLKDRYTLDLKLSTHGFNLEDVEFLKFLLDKKYNSKFSIINDKGNNFLAIWNRDRVKDILNDIDEYWVWPLDRKSNLWRCADFKVKVKSINPNCSECNGSKVIRDGKRFLKFKGYNVQYYWCKDCEISYYEE